MGRVAPLRRKPPTPDLPRCVPLTPHYCREYSIEEVRLKTPQQKLDKGSLGAAYLGGHTRALDNEMDERQRIHSEIRQDLLKRQLSNAENFDKAILSLSTAGLGFSLAFIKDILPLSNAAHMILLHVSWFLFGAAIVSTVLSFMLSQRGINKQLEFTEKYYSGEDEEYLTRRNWQASATTCLNSIAGAVFIGAICLTIAFVSLNVRGGSGMGQKEKAQQVPLREGAPVPAMQNVPGGDVEKGAPIPRLQPVPSPVSTTTPANQGREVSQGDNTTSQSSSSSGGVSTGGNSR